jgi:hypothetical protein
MGFTSHKGIGNFLKITLYITIYEPIYTCIFFILKTLSLCIFLM